VACVQAELGDPAADAPVVRVVHVELQGAHDVGVARGFAYGRVQRVFRDLQAGIPEMGGVDVPLLEHPPQCRA
jgi:hypothetical protein